MQFAVKICGGVHALMSKFFKLHGFNINSSMGRELMLLLN